MTTRFVLDRAGVGRILKSPGARRLVREAASRVAANVDGDTEVSAHETDRATASVVHKHPRALGLQAERGTLTRAASAAGLEVKGR